LRDSNRHTASTSHISYCLISILFYLGIYLEKDVHKLMHASPIYSVAGFIFNVDILFAFIFSRSTFGFSDVCSVSFTNDIDVILDSV